MATNSIVTNMLKELTKLANDLDSKGLTKEADILDEIIKQSGAKSQILPILVKGPEVEEGGSRMEKVVKLKGTQKQIGTVNSLRADKEKFMPLPEYESQYSSGPNIPPEAYIEK